MSIIRTSSYLLSKVEDTNQHAKYIERIVSQTKRIETLIADLNLIISLDNLNTIKTHTIHVPDILRYLEEYARHQQSDESNLTISFLNELTTVHYIGNEELLAQALKRIVDNAIRYSDENGKVIVHATSNTNAVIIAIEDHGIGMNEDTVNRMYEQFFRADPSRTQSGFGLGLSIVKRIIDLHQGTIEVDTELNVGSTFAVKLSYDHASTSTTQ